MKAWSIRFLLILLLAAAGAWGWKVMFPSPEKVIRKRLDDVARLASVEGAEGQLTRFSKAQSLASFFTQDVEISVEMTGYPGYTLEGRDELLQAAAMARSRGTLKVDLVDVTVSVDPDQQSAQAHFTGKARLSSERALQAQEMRAYLVKLDGDWLIRRVETVRTLR